MLSVTLKLVYHRTVKVESWWQINAWEFGKVGLTYVKPLRNRDAKKPGLGPALVVEGFGLEAL